MVYTWLGASALFAGDVQGALCLFTSINKVTFQGGSRGK